MCKLHFPYCVCAPYATDLMSKDQETELQPLRLKDLVMLRSQNVPELIGELRANLTDSVKKSSAIIVNTMDFLEQNVVKQIQGLFPASVFTIGPFHKLAPDISSSLLKEDTNCISWLDRQAPNSVIYVSFGSIASMDEKEFLETYWGLANSDQPFLWVVRPGLVRGSKSVELLPKSFEERVGDKGCIVEWAPQLEVLAHGAVGGFWSHCGWNSTLESICEGVPMLCRPFFGDQCLNAMYVCDVWKVGLELENELEKGNIEKAVRTLMVNTEGNEMRKRAMHLKEKVNLSLRQGGSCYNSLNELAGQMLSLRSN